MKGCTSKILKLKAYLPRLPYLLGMQEVFPYRHGLTLLLKRSLLGLTSGLLVKREQKKNEVNLMFSRISNVSFLDIISLDETSTLQIGDSDKLKPSANVLAVQREKAMFWEDEFRFRDYPLFQVKIPQPYVHEQVNMFQFNQNPMIDVKNVKVSFLAASSNVHIGSTQMICSEAKVLNIRHLITKDVEE